MWAGPGLESVPCVPKAVPALRQDEEQSQVLLSAERAGPAPATLLVQELAQLTPCQGTSASAFSHCPPDTIEEPLGPEPVTVPLLPQSRTRGEAGVVTSAVTQPKPGAHPGVTLLTALPLRGPRSNPDGAFRYPATWELIILLCFISSAVM